MLRTMLLSGVPRRARAQRGAAGRRVNGRRLVVLPHLREGLLHKESLASGTHLHAKVHILAVDLRRACQVKSGQRVPSSALTAP